jgi:SAM-dependent methyltransferase
MQLRPTQESDVSDPTEQSHLSVGTLFDARCPMCGSPGDAKDTWIIPDRLYATPGRFEVWRCSRCASTWVRNPPADVSACYPPGYYSYGPGARPVGLRVAMRRAVHSIARVASTRTRLWRRICPPMFEADWSLARCTGKQLQVLDVGCGSGKALDLYRLAGHDTYGVEISAEAASVATKAGHQVRVVASDDTYLPEGPFGIVRATHTIEHTADPLELLERLASRVDEDGVLLVEVPNTGGLLSRVFGRYWWQLDPPRHLAIPGREALLGRLEELGFSETEYDTYSYGVSVARCLALWTRRRQRDGDGLLSRPAGKWTKFLSLVFTVPSLVADWSGSGDNLRVVARRSPKGAGRANSPRGAQPVRASSMA